MPTEIPIIDIAPFRDGSDRQSVAQQVDAACREIGFFVVTGHGFDLDLLHRARGLAQAFFDLPVDQKAKASHEGFIGYSPLAAENLAYSLGERTPPDLKEAFTLRHPDRDQPSFTSAANVFPDEPAELGPVSETCFRAMAELSDLMMELFAVALALPDDHFVPNCNHHSGAVRYIHYPALTEPALPGQLRAGAHTDYGSFTLVNFNEASGGLQVRHRDGGWIDVPVVGDSFVCNIGDMLEVWTNDRWVSTLHRVALPPVGEGDAERLTVVYFANANNDALLTALPSCVDDDHPARYAPITASEHVRNKLERGNRLLDDQTLGSSASRAKP